MLLALVLAFVLPLVVEISDEYVRAAQVALLVSVGTFLLRFPLGLFSYLLAGQQRYDVLNIGNLLGRSSTSGSRCSSCTSATAGSSRSQ